LTGVDIVLTIIDSTISGDMARSSGGGVAVVFSTLNLLHSTVTANRSRTDPVTSGTGGGVFQNNTPLSVVTIDHTIVAGNFRGASTRDDVSGAVTARYSLFGVNTGSTITDQIGNQIGTATLPKDPLLGPLANNGGPTLTHALTTGSPAIDMGDMAAMAGAGQVPANDQRGAPFTRVADGDGAGGARIDVGAFELQPTGPALLGDYNLNHVVDAADYTVWRNSLGVSGLINFAGADGSGNGTVGPEDYAIWRNNYGMTSPGAGSGGLAAIAEPANSLSDEESGGEIATVSVIAIDATASSWRTSATRLRLDKTVLSPRQNDAALVAWLARCGNHVSQAEVPSREALCNDQAADCDEFELACVDDAFAMLAGLS
jgi:hypothetical protein